MKQMITLTLVCCLSFLLSACETQTADAPDQEEILEAVAQLDARSICDTNTGLVISVGMSKSEVEEVLGAGAERNERYYYSSFGLYLGYDNDIVTQMESSDPRWVIADSIGVGTDIGSLDDNWSDVGRYLVKVYDENNKPMALDDMFYAYITVALGHQEGLVDVILLY